MTKNRPVVTFESSEDEERYFKVYELLDEMDSRRVNGELPGIEGTTNKIMELFGVTVKSET